MVRKLDETKGREGRRKIVIWEKMKRELKRKYLLDNYRQDAYMKIHNFRQKDMSVEEYTTEFDSLMIKGDLRETEEQSIARYLGGLKYEIFDVVSLQPFWSLIDVMKLALKVEKQLQEKRSSANQFRLKSEVQKEEAS